MPRREIGPDGRVHLFPDTATDAQVQAAMQSEYGSQAPAAQPTAPAGPMDTLSQILDHLKRSIGTVGGQAVDVAKGVGKGAIHTALDAGQLVNMIPGVGAATSAIGNVIGGAAGQALYGEKAAPVSSDAAFTEARDKTAYTNTPQMIGGGLETLAEMAIPVTKAVDALPSAARAGQKFEQVMGAAKNVPVDVTATGDVALRIQQLADRGGAMPMAVRKLLKRITDPAQAPMAYEEARDFASNISRLSVNEFGRLTPVVAREVAGLRVTLNKAIADAAEVAGKGPEYKAAMREYAKAMKLKDLLASVAQGAKKAAPYAIGAGAGAGTGYWMTKQISHLLGGGD